jgi:hypothetical protein
MTCMMTYMWKMTDNQSYSNSTADISRIDTTLPFYKKIIGFIRRKYLSKMQPPEELTGEVNDEMMNSMRWELSLVGLNTGEINQQVDAFIEYNYHLHTKGWGSVKFEFSDDDQTVDKQRDTPVPSGTCCLGTLELASSKMEVVCIARM